MSVSRRDPRKAKLRREKIRREKQARNAPPPPPSFLDQHPFASERSMREIEALMEGHRYNSVDELNARLQELTASGRISEMAGAWKQDDPKWRAQEMAYDALETDDLETALRLVHEALEVDPNCIDAQRLMVSLLPATLENKLMLMQEVVDRAEQNLGESFFREHMGHFWGTIATRPYMRAKQHLAELLTEAGRRKEATAVYERMLELNPHDNQGMRYPLLGLYLAANQREGAQRIFASYPGEEEMTASVAWAHVLERWLADDPDEAQAALARARKVNPFAERYISGAKALPRDIPGYYRAGDETEAQICARELELAWKSHPGFREWLRAPKPESS